MSLLVQLLLSAQFLFATWGKTADPLPVLPMPSSRQLRFQSRRFSVFFHFGVNTFTDSERGSGQENPYVFNPHSLNCSQWIHAAKQAGAELVILTAKHHDGFCLWPSSYTNFSVATSPWKNGTGDVVREFVEAATDAGLDVGIYLSPWDLHESSYGDTLLYNEFYLAQLRELLTNYGTISEVWLDGAKSEDATDMSYMFESWFETIHQLQPTANIFSDAGPDIRWVGDEWGEAGETCWSMVNKSSITIGKSEGPYLMSGEVTGMDWIPPECDISIRPGWFWHGNERPKSLEQLLDVYYKSSGRNCLLLLNMPPNTSGLIQDEDLQVLKDFKSALDATFSMNFAKNASVVASSIRGGNSSRYQPGNVLEEGTNTYWAAGHGELNGWLELDLGETVTFNVVEIREPVAMGQRVKEFHVEVWDGQGWRCITTGTTVGFRRLQPLSEQATAQVVRFVIHDSRADPLICYFGLFLDKFAVDGGLQLPGARGVHSAGSQALQL